MIVYKRLLFILSLFVIPQEILSMVPFNNSLEPSTNHFYNSAQLRPTETTQNNAPRLTFEIRVTGVDDYSREIERAIRLKQYHDDLFAQERKSMQGVHSLIQDVVSIRTKPIALHRSDLFKHSFQQDPLADLHQANKLITSFCNKYNIEHDTIAACLGELTRSKPDMIPLILNRYDLNFEQATELLEYVKRCEEAVRNQTIEKIKRLHSSCQEEFQSHLSAYSPSELAMQKQSFQLELERLDRENRVKIQAKNIAQSEHNTASQNLQSRSFLQKGLEALHVWTGDYREDYYQLLEKIDQRIAELNNELACISEAQNVANQKIAMIEEAEQNALPSYQQQLLEKSAAELKILLDEKQALIQSIGINNEYQVPQALIDAHKLELACLEEAYKQKKMQEEILDLYETYENEINTLNDTDSRNLIITARLGSLQEAQNNNFAVSAFHFQITPEAKTLLEEQKIDATQFEFLQGNAFAGQLCKEQCDIINHTGQLRETLKNSPHYQEALPISELLNLPDEDRAYAIQSSEQLVDGCLLLTTDATLLANQATHFGHLRNAARLNDYSWAMLNFCDSVIKTTAQCSKEFLLGFIIDGPLNACKGFYHLGAGTCHVLGSAGYAFQEIINHPQTAIPHYTEQAIEVAKAIYTLMKPVGYHSYQLIRADYSMRIGNYEEAMRIYVEEAKLLEPLENAILEYFQSKTLPEISRDAGALYSEMLVSNGILRLIGKTYCLAKASSIRTAKMAQELLTQSIEACKIPEVVMQTPEGLIVQASRKSFEFAKQTSKRLQSVAKKTRVRECNPKYYIPEQWRLGKLKEFSNHIATARKHLHGFSVKKTNLKHIFGIDEKKRTMSIATEIKHTGFHHIHKKAITEEFGKKGINRIKNPGQILKFKNWCESKKDLIVEITQYFPETGVYRGIIKFDGRKAKAPKTFFPAHWSRKHTILKIWEAYENPIEPLTKNKKGFFSVIGETKEKMKIKIVIDPIKELIHTAYPHIPKKK